MSARGVDFLEGWIQRNVTDGDRHGDSIRAIVLADRCRADAAALGIKRDDMEPAGGSVESIIYEAMLHLDEPGTPGH